MPISSLTKFYSYFNSFSNIIISIQLKMSIILRFEV